MKTPRIALFAALFVAAVVAAHADEIPVSLQGWVAWDAAYVASVPFVTSGGDYKDGVVYCKFPDLNAPQLFINSLSRSAQCVVIGTGPGGKVGGKIGGGWATWTNRQGPTIGAPGSSGVSGAWVLTVAYINGPYANQQIMLTKPAAAPPYDSYVAMGQHLTYSGGSTPAPKKKSTTVAHTYWCNPADGKITTVPPGKKPAGAKKVAKKTSPCAVAAKTETSAVVVATVNMLSARELTWLDKRQAADYAADKATAEGKTVAAEKTAAIDALLKKYRALIVENLAPNTDASGKYTTAAADPAATATTIDAALPADVWGGKVSAVVGLSGDNADVQLTKAEYDVLSKTPPAKPAYTAALEAYTSGRKSVDGNGATSPSQAAVFKASLYDPIVLHRTVIAARAVLKPAGSTTTVDDKPVPNLTEDQKKLLTPDELKNYNAIYGIAKGDPADPNLKKLNADLAARIVSEARTPYVAPSNKSKQGKQDFAKMQDWQKEKFCDPLKVGRESVGSDTTGDDFTLNQQGIKDVRDTGKVKSPANIDDDSTPPTNGAPPSWAKGECAKFFTSQANKPGGKKGSKKDKPVDANLVVNGPDADGKEVKTPSKYFTAPLMVSAAGGALIGLAIGSCFGPLGLILGPIIGALVSYGLNVAKNKATE